MEENTLDLFFTCNHCEKIYSNTEKHFQYNNLIICNTCRLNYYEKCCHCDNLIYCDNVIFVNGKIYCLECVNNYLLCCDNCHNFCEEKDAYTTSVGCKICNTCYTVGYFTCSECNLIYRNEYRTFNRICNICYTRLYNLHSFDYKPNVCFHHYKDQDDNRKSNLHIGIELEIQGGCFENKINFKKLMADKFTEDYFYLKEDGSLNCYGAEIVSHPMTYKSIIADDCWFNVFEIMKQCNMNNINNCGLHFHLDREYLTQDNIKVIDYIVNNFSKCFEEIGGRTFNGYSRYCQVVVKGLNSWGINTTNRYVAVNLANENTVELRFCQSTKYYNTFLERLKMICVIVEFAKTYTISEVFSMTITDFTNCFNQVSKKLYGMFLLV